MTSEPRRDDVSETAGASTDQHITDHDEEGESLVDQPPTSKTPADGSSNKGINTTRANRPERFIE
jgi:hypothetical protein